MFKFFKNSQKNFKVELVNSDTEFLAEKGVSLLYSALLSGFKWPHRCKVGSCGSCRCQLLQGEVKAQIDFSYVLDEPEIQQGYVLACQAVPKSDLVIKINVNNKPLWEKK